MPAERTTMLQVREVLRLKFVGGDAFPSSGRTSVHGLVDALASLGLLKFDNPPELKSPQEVIA